MAMSMFEHLTNAREDGIQTSEEYFERQVKERNPVLFGNTSSWVSDAFELGLLYWAHNEIRKTTGYFEACIKANRLRVEQYRVLLNVPEAREAFEEGLGKPERLARLAGYFTSQRVEKVRSGIPAADESPGYEPWFDVTFIDACVDGSPIDAAAFEQSKQVWTQRRFPISKLAEYDFYREVLEGSWSSRNPDEMLQQHAKLYAKRAKRKDGDLIAGEGEFNTLVVDFIFAAILKHIGWQGEYRHAWPSSGIVPDIGSSPTTTTTPSSFLTVPSSARSPGVARAPAADHGPLLDILAAIEARISDQDCRSRAEQENPEKSVQKLEAIGVGQDRELAEIVRRYRLSALASPRQNAGALSDPAEMAEWTEYFRTHHGMSDALVLLTAPIEIPDWEAPEGGQFVYSLRDGKIYLADVEDLPDPSRIVAQAQPGVSMWPSFGAFLFWYLGGS